MIAALPSPPRGGYGWSTQTTPDTSTDTNTDAHYKKILIELLERAWITERAQWILRAGRFLEISPPELLKPATRAAVCIRRRIRHVFKPPRLPVLLVVILIILWMS